MHKTTHSFFVYSVVVACLGAMTLTGCHKSAQPTQKPTPLLDIAAPTANLTPVFQESLKAHARLGSKTDTRSVSFLQPAIDGNLLIVAQQTGLVHGIQDGKRIWTVSVREPIVSGVGYDAISRTAIVTTRAGNVVVINGETGDVLWQKVLNTTVLTPALIAGNRILLSANNGMIYGLNLQTGASIWQFNSQNPAVSVRGAAKPLRLDGNTALFGAADGRIYALSVDAGLPLWSRRVGVAIGGSDVGRMSDVDGTPLVVDNRLYVTSFSGHMTGFDMSTGQTLFAVSDFSSTRALVYANQILYGVDSQGMVVGFDANTGKRLWQNNALKYRKLSNLAVMGRFVVVGDGEGVVHIFDEKGDLVGRTKLKNKAAIISLQADNQTLYAQTSDGQIAAWRMS